MKFCKKQSPVEYFHRVLAEPHKSAPQISTHPLLLRKGSRTSFLPQARCTTPNSSHSSPPHSCSSQSSQVHWRWSIIPLHYSIPFWARILPQTLTHSPAKRSSLTYPFPLLFPTPEEALLVSSHGCHRCLCWKSLPSIWLPAEQMEGLLSCCSKYKTPWLIIAQEGTEIQGQHMFKQSARSQS